MALSNIFREPRRELTESAVGTLVVALFLGCDYLFAHSFQIAVFPNEPIFGTLVGMFLGVMALFLAIFFGLIIPHWIGEEICAVLARHGVEVRPKMRNPWH